MYITVNIEKIPVLGLGVQFQALPLSLALLF